MAGLPTGAFDNAEAIYKELLSWGLSTNAASGVAGNIYQESHGNPGSSSGAGGGLFGETLANGGTVGGGSLAQQMQALKDYIAKNGSLSDINAHAGSPAAAATWFSDHYERPGIPALSNRIDAAQWVADSAKTGNWGSSAGSNQPTSGGGGGILSIPQDITDAFTSMDGLVNKLMWLVTPSHWVRIAAFFLGIILLMFAFRAFIAAGEGSPIIPKINVAPVPV